MNSLGTGVSIRAKLIVMVAGTLIVGMTSAAFLIRGLVYQNIVSQKMKMVEILTASLVHDIKSEFHSDKPEVVPTIIAKYSTYYRIIRNISFYDHELVRVAGSMGKPIGQRATDPNVVTAIQLAKPTINVAESEGPTLGIRSIAPVLQGSKIVGAVAMDISIEDIHTTLSAIDRRILTILIVTVFAASAVLFALLRTSILLRLTRLVSVTRQIAVGNYGTEIKDPRRDEIGSLAQAFDRMTADLRRSKKEIDDYNQLLEHRVQEQTAKLQQAYGDLQDAQGQLVLREKMASLGILISGIAHELNTPVGAIHNIARNLHTKIVSLPRALEVFKNAPDPAGSRFTAFLEELVESSGGINQSFSYAEIRQIERVLQTQGIEQFRERAGALAKLKFGNPDRIQAYIEFIRDPALFSVAESFGSIAQAARISETSSQKIAEIVRALKYYAYTDKGQFERIQINESIQTALVLLRNRLKHTTSLITDFAPDLPHISCTSDIHQVWTNLLTNACDAIDAVAGDHHGELSIKTEQHDDRILVTVSDNGIGISDETINKIFDPFFTTKDIGKGTGLGLSIVAGIVKKHRGTVSVTSRQGPTVFQIDLPVHQNDEHDRTPDDDETARTGKPQPSSLLSLAHQSNTDHERR